MLINPLRLRSMLMGLDLEQQALAKGRAGGGEEGAEQPRVGRRVLRQPASRQLLRKGAGGRSIRRREVGTCGCQRPMRMLSIPNLDVSGRPEQPST